MTFDSVSKSVTTCTSCGWDHKGDEELGLEILTDYTGKHYFICILTKEKVFIA